MAKLVKTREWAESMTVEQIVEILEKCSSLQGDLLLQSSEMEKLRAQAAEDQMWQHRAIYVLNVIAGIVPGDPRKDMDPVQIAREWLDGYGFTYKPKPLMGDKNE